MSQTDAPAPNLAVLKGITLGLGVLLIGGLALLGVMIARGGGAEDGPGIEDGRYVLELAEGDRLVGVEVDAAGATMTVERADGRVSLITTSRETGVVSEVVLPAGAL